jgi:pantothenate kinase
VERSEIKQLVDAVHDASTGGQPLLVGIAGPPGSGKTHLAAGLTRSLGAVTVPMDGFHLANRQLDALGLRDVKGAPETFDRVGLLAALQRLPADEPVYFPDFSHEQLEPIAASIRVEPDCPVVIVEGNYLLLDRPGWRELTALFGITVFLDVPWRVCRPRLLARHEAAGMTPPEAQKWVDRSDRANFELITGERLPADVQVDEFGVVVRNHR